MELRKVAIRAGSGLVYCAIIIGCIFWGYQGMTALAILFSVLGCIEFSKISRDLTTTTLPALILDIVGCVCLCLNYVEYSLLLWCGVMICRFILELYIPTEHPLRGLSHSVLTQVYIGFPMAIMTWVAFNFSAMPLLAIFFFLWINDTGAFLVGSICGRHKLFERISPKKTWEGFWGGFVFCLLAAYLFYTFCADFFNMQMFGMDLVKWLLLGALVSVFGTWGDLIESMIKRTLQVKDSGNLIPGHGGILDRIDSLLLVLPTFALYIAFLLN